jgi:hypothetical protein
MVEVMETAIHSMFARWLRATAITTGLSTFGTAVIAEADLAPVTSILAAGGHIGAVNTAIQRVGGL